MFMIKKNPSLFLVAFFPPILKFRHACTINYMQSFGCNGSCDIGFIGYEMD